VGTLQDYVRRHKVRRYLSLFYSFLPPRFLALVVLTILTVPIYRYISAESYFRQELRRMTMNAVSSLTNDAYAFHLESKEHAVGLHSDQYEDELYRRRHIGEILRSQIPAPDSTDAIILSVQWLFAIALMFHVVAGSLVFYKDEYPIAVARDLPRRIGDGNERRKHRG